VARWTGYREHLKDITGLDVETFEASDYNGVIQAISSGQVDIATMGGGSYANVDAQVGSKVRPFLTIRQAEGGLGYYSALIVKADSSYRTLDELKGKSIAYVDFNSTSGYIFPRDTLLKQGYDPEKHFAKAIMAGGASQALLAVVNGRVDAAMTTVSAGTPETGFAAGSHITLARSGMINAGDVRIIWTAGPIANSPYVIRTDRPQAFQDVIRGAFAMLPYEKPQVWDDMGQALGNDFAPVSRDNYTDIIAIRDREIKARRKGGGGK
jgi:phosphonate transport system substrate-binding protein